MSKSKKEVLGFIKLQVPSGKANPAPPIGPALGQKGLNIMEFCKQFNALKFEGIDAGAPIPVIITAYKDKSFTFITKTPPASTLLRKAAGISKGSGTPNTEKVGTVTKKQIEEIVNTKFEDLNAIDMEAGIKIIEGTARSMGITVKGTFPSNN